VIEVVREVDQEGVEDRGDEVDSEAAVVVVEAEEVEEVSRHGRGRMLSRHSGYEVLSNWLHHQHAGYLAWSREVMHICGFTGVCGHKIRQLRFHEQRYLLC
jgi:hypothetical protein